MKSTKTRSTGSVSATPAGADEPMKSGVEKKGCWREVRRVRLGVARAKRMIRSAYQRRVHDVVADPGAGLQERQRVSERHRVQK